MAYCHAMFASGPDLMQRLGSLLGPLMTKRSQHAKRERKQREVFALLTLGSVLGGDRASSMEGMILRSRPLPLKPPQPPGPGGWAPLLMHFIWLGILDSKNVLTRRQATVSSQIEDRGSQSWAWIQRHVVVFSSKFLPPNCVCCCCHHLLTLLSRSGSGPTMRFAHVL